MCPPPPTPCPEAPGSRWVEEEGRGGVGEPPAGSPSRKLAMRSVFPLASGKKSHAHPLQAQPNPGGSGQRRAKGTPSLGSFLVSALLCLWNNSNCSNAAHFVDDIPSYQGFSCL